MNSEINNQPAEGLALPALSGVEVSEVEGKRKRGLPAEARRRRGLPTEARRRRGGQPDNQNARTHGFFSSSLSPVEINQFWSVIRRGNIEPEVALLRLKFQSFLLSGSANPRIFKKASRLLTKCYGKGLDPSETKVLKSAIDGMLYDLVLSTKKPTKTNRAYFNNFRPVKIPFSREIASIE